MKPPLTDVTLYIGGVHASAGHSVVRTTLGSCISVCLFDAETCIGGMNHFMLPESHGPVSDPGRYGQQAMELLIGAIQRAGGVRQRLVAKVFGGGHVLDTEVHGDSVPARNIAFAQQYLTDEGIFVAAIDVGGMLPRNIKFETWTGKAFCKRLAKPGARDLGIEERLARRTPVVDRGGELEFFE